MDYKYFLTKLADISNQVDRIDSNLYKYYAMSWENRSKVKKAIQKIQDGIKEIAKIIGETA